MRKLIGLVAGLSVLWAVQAGAQVRAGSAEPPATSAPSNARPFALARLLTRLTPGQSWISPHSTVLCLPQAKIPWAVGQGDLRDANLIGAFQAEMKAAGYKVVGGEDNIFETENGRSDLEIGGVLTEINADYCSIETQAQHLRLMSSGSAAIKMQWQVFSSQDKVTLAKIDTQGSATSREQHSADLEAMLAGAFRQNVRALIISDAFRRAVAPAPVQTAALADAGPQSIIALPGALAAQPRSIHEAVNSVVLIRAGGAMGSGFLVSSDGLLITDEHVVGDAKTVKVRWSDGSETTGEVIRVSKYRDVALIRADAHGRPPLLLRRDPAEPGDSVYAIGMPLDPALQNTVTHGVVSAYRNLSGLNYIQSDVTITHGNSGGPLLDEKGAVIGICDLTMRPEGFAEGLNFFTPVADALAYLGAARR